MPAEAGRVGDETAHNPRDAPSEARRGTDWLQDPARSKAVERTRLGFGVLVVAAVAGFIPYAVPIAIILGLAGMALVFLGREGFGPDHARSVGRAVALLVVSVVVIVVAMAAVTVLGLGASSGSTGDGSFARSMYLARVGSSIAFLPVGGAISFLFAYHLAGSRGRNLLRLALVGYVGAAVIAAVFLVGSGYAGATAQRVAEAGLRDTATMQAAVDTLALFKAALTALPGALVVWTYIRVWRRIDRGEVSSRRPGPTLVARA